VIIYEESKPREDGAAPEWLAGAADLQRREGSGKRWWGIGDGPLVGPHQLPSVQVADTIRATLLPGLEPLRLAIDQRWCPTSIGDDLVRRSWRMPCVLSQSGDRQFRTAYGEDCLPLLTPTQDRAEKVAQAARAAIVASVTDGTGIPQQHACRWAADLLSCVNHISALGLLDDALIAATLYTAAGLTPRLES
jgi:hypothetical protein